MDWSRVGLGVALFVALAIGSVAVTAAQDNPTTDNTVTRIDVQSDGDAVWRITFRTQLENESDVQQYRDFQSEIENGSHPSISSFKSRMQTTVSEANKTHDRKMAVQNFSVSTEIQETPRQWGSITYTFTWTNFATTSSGTVVVEDVFQGGFYLSKNDLLIVSPPDGYTIQGSDPEPTETRDEAVVWEGPISFNDERPRVVIGEIPETSEATSDTPVNQSGEDEQTEKTVLADILLPLTGTVVTFSVLWRRLRLRERRETEDIGGEEPHGQKEDEAGSSSEDTELLTDEERVVKFVEGQGGRVKQAEIVEEMSEWSEAKVSMVLSDMEDEGVIEKLRIGRENVIELSEKGS